MSPSFGHELIVQLGFRSLIDRAGRIHLPLDLGPRGLIWVVALYALAPWLAERITG